MLQSLSKEDDQREQFLEEGSSCARDNAETIDFAWA